MQGNIYKVQCGKLDTLHQTATWSIKERWCCQNTCKIFQRLFIGCQKSPRFYETMWVFGEYGRLRPLKQRKASAFLTFRVSCYSVLHVQNQRVCERRKSISMSITAWELQELKRQQQIMSDAQIFPKHTRRHGTEMTLMTFDCAQLWQTANSDQGGVKHKILGRKCATWKTCAIKREGKCEKFILCLRAKL